MAVTAYFQSRKCPDRKYRVVAFDKVKQIVTLEHDTIEFTLPMSIVRANGFKIVKEPS